MQETTERWNNNRRADGLSVVEGLDGWIIMALEGGPALSECPACGKPFLNAHAARRMADLVYPLSNGERRKQI